MCATADRRRGHGGQIARNHHMARDWNAKKGTPFPLFLLSRLNLVAQPNLLLNSVSGEQQAHSLASSCVKCFRNS